MQFGEKSLFSRLSNLKEKKDATARRKNRVKNWNIFYQCDVLYEEDMKTHGRKKIHSTGKITCRSANAQPSIAREGSGGLSA